MPRLRLTCIVGARPNFIKISPLFREFNRRESFTPRLVHTGQHFSRDMSDTFFEQLGIPAPGFSTALAYYDGLRAERLPAALVQGQRDFFGAHTYRRVDRPGTFHTLWGGDRGEVPA